MEILELARSVRERFTAEFDRSPRLFRAPGRANLIGEHTDYNDGFVLPFAIDRSTVVAAAARDDGKLNVTAVDLDESFTIDLGSPEVKRRGTWVDYVEGTARSLSQENDIKGADLTFSSTVPIGGGLSSSAALEVSIGFALLSISGVAPDLEKLALAAQRAENEFVGIRSGIMDQFAAAFGKKGNAMLLDCRSREIEYIPLELGDAAIVVCDTKVKHELASSAYNERRRECEEGVELMKKDLPEITALRDVSLDDFLRLESKLPEPVRSRCRHVITENGRTVEAADAFSHGRLEEAGKLMFESHRSLKEDYEVSAPELDVLVDSARSVEGVYGARMTGGGFGGCTVNLLDRASIDRFRETVTKHYEARFGFEPEIYLFQAADGASELTVS